MLEQLPLQMTMVTMPWALVIRHLSYRTRRNAKEPPSFALFVVPPSLPLRFPQHAPEPATRSSSFAIFVGGWERPLATQVRQAWYKAALLPNIPEELHPGATFKGQPMKRHFTIVFENREDSDGALDALKKDSYVFDGVSYGKKYDIYIKVERSCEIRQVGKFRHHFHEALETHFEALGKKEVQYRKGN